MTCQSSRPRAQNTAAQMMSGPAVPEMAVAQQRGHPRRVEEQRRRPLQRPRPVAGMQCLP